MTLEVAPYGDSTGDGMVQLSFTLPLAHSERARGAALALARKLDLARPQIVHMKAVGPDFTFFIVYGSTRHVVDLDELQVEERAGPVLAAQQVDRLIRQRLKRQLVVVGACTGTDAHTVGLDAILSLKGYAGDKGLEHLHEMRVLNLGAQVEPVAVVEATREHSADAVLVSQVVTQRDAHLLHLRQVREALEQAGLRERVVLVGGGPGLTPDQAAELGYDRIFGRGTRPPEVASYLAMAVVTRATGDGASRGSELLAGESS